MILSQLSESLIELDRQKCHDLSADSGRPSNQGVLINQHGTRWYHGQEHPLGSTDPIFVSRTYRAIAATRNHDTTNIISGPPSIHKAEEWGERLGPPDGAEFCELELLNLLLASHANSADSPELGIGPTFHISLGL